MPNTNTNINFLLLTTISLFTYLSSCQIVDYGHIYISSSNSDTTLQTTTITYSSSYISSNNSKYSVVLSLSSFSYPTKNQTVVRLSSITRTSAKIWYSNNVKSFSYIVIFAAPYLSIGILVATFPSPPSIKQSKDYTIDYIDTNTNALSGVLNYTGTVQPFISALYYDFSQNYTKTSVSVKWYPGYDRNNSLIVNRTRDITRIEFTYFIHLQITRYFLNVVPLYSKLRFQYQNTASYMFNGVRGIQMQNTGKSAYWIFSSSVTASFSNMVLDFYYLENQTVTYDNNSYFDGRTLKSSVTNSLIASSKCTSPNSAFSIYGLVFCVPKNASEFVISNINKANQSINFGTNVSTAVSVKSDSKCLSYTESAYYIVCNACVSGKNLVLSGNTCICQDGYFLSSDSCVTCNSEICPWTVDYSLKLKSYSENSTEYFLVSIVFNDGLDGIYPVSTYQKLTFSVYVNGSQTYFYKRWNKYNKVTLVVSGFTYLKNYKVTVNILNIIKLSNNGAFTYNSSTSTKDIEYQRPSVAQVISDSISTINSAIPTASLFSALVGAKVNLFSFVQASSVLYLTSYIQWDDYGSVTRTSMTQSLFQFAPTDIFSSFDIVLPLPHYFSDDIGMGNKMLNNNQMELYFTLVPTIIISLVVQIILVEIFYRVLMKVFPCKTKLVEYEVKKDGKVVWVKKSFLARFMDDEQMEDKGFRYKMGPQIQSMASKRFIFYTNLISSQLVYHAFMIFSQFYINVSTFQQVLNAMATIFLMGMIVSLPILGPSTPMNLLKSIDIVQKQKDYSQSRLTIYFIINILQPIVLGASVAIFDNCFLQCIGVITILAIKVVIMWGYIKLIEFIKIIVMIALFCLLGFGNYFPTSLKKQLQTITIIVMVTVAGLEMIKMFRSLIVSILGNLRDPPSFQGKAIVKKVTDYKIEHNK